MRLGLVFTSEALSAQATSKAWVEAASEAEGIQGDICTVRCLIKLYAATKKKAGTQAAFQLMTMLAGMGEDLSISQALSQYDALLTQATSSWVGGKFESAGKEILRSGVGELTIRRMAYYVKAKNLNVGSYTFNGLVEPSLVDFDKKVQGLLGLEMGAIAKQVDALDQTKEILTQLLKNAQPSFIKRALKTTKQYSLREPSGYQVVQAIDNPSIRVWVEDSTLDLVKLYEEFPTVEFATFIGGNVDVESGTTGADDKQIQQTISVIVNGEKYISNDLANVVNEIIDIVRLELTKVKELLKIVKQTQDIPAISVLVAQYHGINRRPISLIAESPLQVVVGNITSGLHVDLVVDPLSEFAQKGFALARLLHTRLHASVKLTLLPTPELESLPLQNYFRLHVPGSPPLDKLPSQELLTLKVFTSAEVIAFPLDTQGLDTDNLKGHHINQVQITYYLAYVGVRGHAYIREQSKEPPAGMQIELVEYSGYQPDSQEIQRVADTMVMANLGYFQMRVPTPGVFKLRILADTYRYEYPCRNYYSEYLVTFPLLFTRTHTI